MRGNSPRLIKAWRPADTETIIWAIDMSRMTPLRMVLSSDNRLSVPVIPDIKIGVGTYNGSKTFWKGYPIFVDGANLWSGGTADPNTCSNNEMWQLPPDQSGVFDALMNRNCELGRPLTVVYGGSGYGIGEATFHTMQLNGQIVIYERIGVSGPKQTHPTPYYPPGVRKIRSERTFREPDRSVATGAGQEEYRAHLHVHSGVIYSKYATKIAALQLEDRRSVAASMDLPINQADHIWYWTPPSPNWFRTWGIGSVEHSPATAPQVPFAPGAHLSTMDNRGSGW